MKEKIFFSIILLVTLISITGCNNDNPIVLKDITIEIKEDSLTSTGATIIITDLSKNNNSYGDWYRIDKKINDKWKELKSEQSWFNLPGYYVDENNKLELKVDWEAMYGRLDNGEYRLVKEVNNKYIACEFIIK